MGTAVGLGPPPPEGCGFAVGRDVGLPPPPGLGDAANAFFDVVETCRTLKLNMSPKIEVINIAATNPVGIEPLLRYLDRRKLFNRAMYLI